MNRLINSSRIILLVLLQMGFALSAYADLYKPVPQCYQPNKPLWFATPYYKERYDNDIVQYQSCMKAFILNEKKAAKMHAQAAQEALRNLDDFIKNQ